MGIVWVGCKNLFFVTCKKFSFHFQLFLRSTRDLYKNFFDKVHDTKIIKMAFLTTPDSETTSPTNDLSWTQLLTDKPRTQKPSIVRIDDKPKEMNPEEQQLNGTNGENGRRVPRERRESIIGTFNRHLRMSLKAVSESPGPGERWTR